MFKKRKLGQKLPVIYLTNVLKCVRFSRALYIFPKVSRREWSRDNANWSNVFFSTSAVTDVRTTCNIRIGSNDKLRQTLSLTKTPFSANIGPHTATYCNRRLPYPSSLPGPNFSACVPGWIIFSLWFRFPSQTPPRKQPGDDRRRVTLPWRRLSNQSTKFHRRRCFLFIATAEEAGKKEWVERK